ncbi:MAG: Crp/Fnr family transcriptional regulator [Leadbetterella sp.]|nr:Crp/Fnr family transcriptional regulator [Leadbetterella sp.]
MLFTELIISYNIFTETEIKKIRSAFVPFSFEANALLLQKGEISDKIFFIESGILREFSFSDADADADEKVQTHWILGENEWIYQVESYILEKPASCYIQALTKLSGFYLSKKNLQVLVSEIPSLSIVILNIYEKYLLQLEYRNSFHRIKNAEKRLEVFEKMHPNLLNRVAGKILASYLNISPEQLSRIRAKRSQN